MWFQSTNYDETRMVGLCIRTSSITQQIWYMHCVIASLVPDMVTARSVELGSISEATWMEAPVTSRISLILEPPLPIKEPHCEAGTISLSVIGGLDTPPPPPAPPPCMSWNWEHHSSNFLHISVNALKIEFVGPVTVTIRSGQEPSEMLIFAPDCESKKEYYRSYIYNKLFLVSYITIDNQCLLF